MVTYYGCTSIFIQFGLFLLLQIDNCYYMYMQITNLFFQIINLN